MSGERGCPRRDQPGAATASFSAARSAQRSQCSEFSAEFSAASLRKVGRCGTSLAMRVRARGARRCRTGCGPRRHAMESPQPWRWMWILGAPLVDGIFDWLRTPKTSIRSASYRSDDRNRDRSANGLKFGRALRRDDEGDQGSIRSAARSPRWYRGLHQGKVGRRRSRAAWRASRAQLRHGDPIPNLRPIPRARTSAPRRCCKSACQWAPGRR